VALLKNPLSPLFRRGLGSVLLTAAIPLHLASAASAETLEQQLRALAQDNNFILRGAEHTGEAPATPVGGTPTEQIKQLLRGFNYVLVQPEGGAIERLIILGEKRAGPPPPTTADRVIPTGRKGDHHTVDSVLVGPSGEELHLNLMIDTGASYVVIARSHADALGLTPEQLRPQEVVTANGKIPALIGKVGMIRLGQVEVPNVEVAFIDDAQIGDNQLLGMSVLGRYRITLDDSANTLTLDQP